MVLEFQVDCSLSCREDNLLDGLATRNLVDLGNVLLKYSEGKFTRDEMGMRAPDEQTYPRRLGLVHGGGHAIRECGPHGRSETSRHLGNAYKCPSIKERG